MARCHSTHGVMLQQHCIFMQGREYFFNPPLPPCLALHACITWLPPQTCLALHACITWLPPQTRLNEETAALERRHAALGRDRDAISAEEEEEAERGAEAATFRTAVLRTRLARHEEAAMARYRALDKRLRADPRLAALMAPA